MYQKKRDALDSFSKTVTLRFSEGYNSTDFTLDPFLTLGICNKPYMY